MTEQTPTTVLWSGVHDGYPYWHDEGGNTVYAEPVDEGVRVWMSEAHTAAGARLRTAEARDFAGYLVRLCDKLDANANTPARSTPDTDLRDRIATAMHGAQCGCSQWTAHEGEDGDPTYNLMADAVLAVVQPELDRRDTEIERLKQRVIDENRAGEINIKTLLELTNDRARLSTALRDMARRVRDERRVAAELRGDGLVLGQAIKRWRDRYFDMVRERDRLAAENAELRAYTETTRYHQQQHAEAHREVVRLRAENEQLAAEVDALDCCLDPFGEWRCLKPLGHHDAHERRLPDGSARRWMPPTALSDAQPRVWRASDPEPVEQVTVRDCQGDLWTKGAGELWESPDTTPFPWARIAKKWGPLTEVPDRGDGGQ